MVVVVLVTRVVVVTLVEWKREYNCEFLTKILLLCKCKNMG